MNLSLYNKTGTELSLHINWVKEVAFLCCKGSTDLSLHTNKEMSYSCITHKVTKCYVTHTMNILIFIILTNKCP